MRADGKSPNTVLLGGPSAIAAPQRLRTLDAAQRKFKLCRGNRYEHFVATDETAEVGDQLLHVFRWTEFTQVAE
ncbi:DUF5988 family protein [Amycolatopsis sp. NPDC059657]|uniref:DUF5988 family protein n=1 Tax=Amycolatopsis sp. NPDC059657 TaxID=3346899 RepID=UPI00366F2A74